MKRLRVFAVIVAALWGILGVQGQQQPRRPVPSAPVPAASQPAKPAQTAKPAGQAQQTQQTQQTQPAQPAQQSQPPHAATPARPLRPTPAAPPTDRGTKRVVDFEADNMRPVKLANDSTALSLQGKVVFYHNGAVIQCDSAVRYNDKRMECFFNVVINKGKTYVYGDRADYNGDQNTARVYAPMIKIVDGDVVMYTYNFAFNTLDNIGRFHGTGTVRQKDNRLEAERGYYYADARRVVCVEKAEMKNEEYSLLSDSVSYDMNTEQAEFYVKSYIWNKGGEILSAERGAYDKRDSAYHFTRAAYVLTSSQELWSDTLHYNSRTENAILRRNIQIRDEEHRTLSFGDYGLWWGKREEAMLTRDPQMFSYEEGGDTLYVRSDSMFLYTVTREAATQVKQIVEQTHEEELIAAPVRGAGPESVPVSAPQVPAEHMELDVIQTDTIDGPTTAVGRMEALDTSAAPLSKKEQKALEKEQKRLHEKAEREVRDAERGRQAAEKQKARTKGRVSEQAHLHEHPEHEDSLAVAAKTKADSLSALAHADSVLRAAKVKTDSLLAGGSVATEKPDSLVRITRAFRNVRMFRNDFQAVCDSLVTFSIDSTAHLYINPVMWNELNQIKSDVIDIYSKNQQIERAVFTGTPIMSSEVDTTRYNQVKGKTIEALFRNNEIYRTDVKGNGQTLYWMTEQDSLGHVDLIGFLVAECADISFDIEEKQVTAITYRGNPVYTIYPIDKVPVEQEQELPGFIWEIKRKPVKTDVYNRTERPSQRAEYEAISRPTFPMTDSIMKHRERMIKDGVWRDRNDTLSEEALLFIRTLGY